MIRDIKINEGQKALYYQKGYWTDETLADVWQHRAAQHASKEYVCDNKGSRYTYGEIDEKASRLANWLIVQGIRAGDVVTMQFPTWAEFCIAYVAVLKVGGVMHPVPRDYTDADLEYVMNLVGSSAYLAPTSSHATSYEEEILEAATHIPTLKAIALLDRVAPAQHEGSTTFSAIFAEYEPLIGVVPVSSDSVACILPTSGTTGKPKQAMLTHNNILFSERAFTRELGRTEADVMFMPSPLNHATGFFHGLISPLILGGRSVLQQDFDAREAIDLVNTEGVTWSMSATPFIYDILNVLDANPELSLETMHLFCCGGAPLPSSLIERAATHGVLLCEVYGSTESCPHVFVPPEHCAEWNGDWSGVPFEGIEIAIVNTEGEEAAPGVQGEELSRGPHMFVGYLNEPERTDRALNDEGWFFSGDLGYIDAKGRLRINGRKKELIIRGGENISAREIDDDLIGCPGVLATATIGMPDERLGERICTFVVATNPEFVPTKESLAAYLESKHVSKRLWPERVEIIDEIPFTKTGKVKRFVLAEELKRRMEAER